MHGWPGSVIEFLDIIEKLASPEISGVNKNNSFDVIVPSLPGFSFSGKPDKPIGPRKMAEILNKLMIKNLGYKNYMAQGGDWGATIANWIGYDHSKFCKALHINCLTMRHPDGPQSDDEKNWQKRFDKDQIMQDGYRTQQATKPQSLSYGMMDSPVGIAAWILEKMYFWSDLKDKNLESVYSKDTLIANIMVYILTKSFNTASWIYFGRREEGGRFFCSKPSIRHKRGPLKHTRSDTRVPCRAEWTRQITNTLGDVVRRVLQRVKTLANSSIDGWGMDR